MKQIFNTITNVFSSQQGDIQRFFDKHVRTPECRRAVHKILTRSDPQTYYALENSIAEELSLDKNFRIQVKALGDARSISLINTNTGNRLCRIDCDIYDEEAQQFVDLIKYIATCRTLLDAGF